MNTAAAAIATFVIQPSFPILSMGLAGAYLIKMGTSSASMDRSNTTKIALTAGTVIGTFVALVYSPWLMTLSITCGVAAAVFLYNLDQTNGGQDEIHEIEAEPGQGQEESKSSAEGRYQKRATLEVGKGSQPLIDENNEVPELEDVGAFEPGEHPPIDTATDIGNLISAVTLVVQEAFIPWANEKAKWAKRNVIVAKNKIGDFLVETRDNAVGTIDRLQSSASQLHQRASQRYQQYQSPRQEEERKVRGEREKLTPGELPS